MIYLLIYTIVHIHGNSDTMSNIFFLLEISINWFNRILPIVSIGPTNFEKQKYIAHGIRIYMDVLDPGSWFLWYTVWNRILSANAERIIYFNLSQWKLMGNRKTNLGNVQTDEYRRKKTSTWSYLYPARSARNAVNQSEFLKTSWSSAFSKYA